MGRVLKRIETLVGLKGIIPSVRFNRIWYENMSSGMWRIVVWLRSTDVSEQLLPVLPLLNTLRTGDADLRF